jgi:hypothetical protein
MSSVADLVDDATLRHLADAETYSRGLELAERVRMAAFGPTRVEAKVESGDPPAVVELTVGPVGLAWQCSDGDASPAIICPHAVAVAVETRRRASSQRA